MQYLLSQCLSYSDLRQLDDKLGAHRSSSVLRVEVCLEEVKNWRTGGQYLRSQLALSVVFFISQELKRDLIPRSSDNFLYGTVRSTFMTIISMFSIRIF